MVELGLLRPQQVEQALSVLRERERGRFGELVLEMDWIDADGLACSLAHQFRLTALPGDRVARLGVGADVMDLLPAAFMRDNVLIPTWFDPERRALSLLVTDPSDVVVLKRAQEYARASQMRLFVSTREAISDLLDRSLPNAPSSDFSNITVTGPRFVAPPPGEGGTVVLETDPGRLAALRRLEGIEGGGTEYVSDPEQVTALLEAGAADRVVHRRAMTSQIEAYRGVWQRARPGVRVIEVVGFTPGRLGLDEDPERDLLFELLRSVVLSGLEPVLSAKVARATDLASSLAESMNLTPDQSRAVTLCALLLHRENTRELLRQRLPFDIDRLLQRLQARREGEPPSVDIAVEVLHTATENAFADDPSAPHPKVNEALRRVLEQEELRSRLSTTFELVQSRLDRMPLVQVLSALVHGRRTAEVSVTGGAQRGVVRLSVGQVVWASWGALSAEHAVVALAELGAGRWEVTFGQAPDDQNVHEATDALLERLS